MNQAQNVIEFYVLCNRLKDTLRTGWKDWNVQRERLESVAELFKVSFMMKRRVLT